MMPVDRRREVPSVSETPARQGTHSVHLRLIQKKKKKKEKTKIKEKRDHTAIQAQHDDSKKSRFIPERRGRGISACSIPHRASLAAGDAGLLLSLFPCGSHRMLSTLSGKSTVLYMESRSGSSPVHGLTSNERSRGLCERTAASIEKSRAR